MTARDDTRAGSVNPAVPQGDDSSSVRTNADAQDVIELLRRSGGRARRQRLKFGTQLPDGILDEVLLSLESEGYITIVPSYSGDRIKLAGFEPASERRER